MQWFNAELDAGFFGVGQHFTQAIEDGGARIVERLPMGRPGDDAEDRSAEDCSLLDGESVVGDAFAALCRSGRREPTSTTQAGAAQAFAAN